MAADGTAAASAPKTGGTDVDIATRMSPSRLAARRQLLRLAAVAYVAAVAIGLTGGGLVMMAGTVRLSARGTRKPLLVMAVAVGAALALSPRGRRWRTLADDWRGIAARLERLLASPAVGSAAAARTAAAAIAVVFVAAALVVGEGSAGAADPYGYVSQARLWAGGVPRVDQPALRDLPAGVIPEAVVPLGYRLAVDGQALVPIYAPGYPLVMALFERVGGPSAVYLVMPLLGGIGVWATFLLGARLVSPAAGVVAASTVATSPAVLSIVMHSPMSDIPTMTWWLLALTAGLGASPGSALAAGLAAGAAILTRPNLVPLAVIVGALPVLNAWRRSTRAAATSGALFALGPIAASLGIVALNTIWYGSPLTSGYGQLAGVLYRWDFFWEDLRRYSRWLWETERWPLLAAAAGAVVMWRRWPDIAAADRTAGVVGALFAAGVCLAYAFYLPIEEWWTLRFLFPALPLLGVAAAVGFLALPASPHALRPAAVILAAALTVASARDRGAFATTDQDRFETMGRYITEHLPPDAVLLSMIHSGSANFYSGRLTMRWDMLRPDQLDPLIAELRRRGQTPFILLDGIEEPQFSRRFEGASRLAALDWEPLATTRGARLFATPDLPAAPPSSPAR